MIGLFIYTLAAFGCAYVVGHSAITLPLRRAIAGEVDPNGQPVNVIQRWVIMLIECPACLGFWLGFAVANIGPANYLDVLANVPPFALAFYTVGTNYILGRLTGLMQ